MNNYKYNIIDMGSADPESIVEHFKTLMRSHGASTYKGDYYCGIATNPDVRFYDHEQKHWDIKRIIGVVDCGNKAKCCKVETMMDNEGFDAGAAPGRGPGDDTRYVYLVEKGALKEDITNPAGSEILMNYLKEALKNKDQ